MGTQVPASSTGLNEAVIYGQFVAEPEVRELPSGSSIASFSLTVRRPGEKTTSVPMSWFDPPAKLWSWTIGDMIVARGNVVRRFYQAGGGVAAATEVSVVQAELARHRVKTSRLLTNSEKAIAEASTVINEPPRSRG